MKKTFKRSLTITIIAAMMAVPAFSAVNANADATDGNTTWYHSPTLSRNHLNDITGVTFNKKTAGGEGTYDVKLKDGEEVYGTPDSPLGKQMAERQKSSSESSNSNETTSESNSNGQNGSSSQSSNASKPEYQGSNTNHGKLVQTGERNTAEYAGLGAVVIALIVFIVAKVRKVAKKD